MVLEQLFKANWLEKRPLYAFVLGVIYASIGIISARIIFPNSSSIMSVAFTAILLIPSLNKLLSDEENREIREKKLSLRLLLKDHADIFEIYFFMFMGVFIIFAGIALLMPEIYTYQAFSSQLQAAGYTGKAFGLDPFMIEIFMNNLLVLFVCFILSLVYGAGSVLFLAWNASVWGIVFGVAFKTPETFFIEIIPILPHLIGETTAYLSAAIVGGVISKAVLREKLFSEKFNHIVTDAGIFLAMAVVLIFGAALIETKVHTYKEIITTATVIMISIAGLAAFFIREKRFILKEEKIVKKKLKKVFD
ncbi:stage II sporulation protein M [Candidatus Woesearchaeota archaeon]|nr:stage II sporulation protein M [Candidatus Woesearchaeota archaeon]